ncbi:peptidylprolyl isomerase [Robertkochia marina]|uniref:Peptidyl-prolyl cis-trans isomerase n=2 Tax=Robertkochia marina TaxID=1227945 RepID=A0A4S3M244_9FLAO|nr:peptidylprolyl isomerase [Robertkochia marina]TRZ44548.1 peptidylprolyl isomerase [Robertkochia marina]
MSFCLTLGTGILLSGTLTKGQDENYPIGQILTEKGEMLIWLHDETPNHKDHFIKLAQENYWDSLSFNRVIKDFVVQGGCPDTPEGFSDSPYLIEPEFNDNLKHIYGAVGAGRDDNPDKLSAGCQFYIVHDKEGIPRLDGNYTIFGQVIKGLDVLEAVATVPTDSLDAPENIITLDVNMLYLTKEQLAKLGYQVDQ